MPVITLEDVARSFGTDILDEGVKQYYDACDWTYEKVAGVDEDGVINDLMDFMVSDSQQVGAPDRKEVWLKGWKENLDAFLKSGDADDLIPNFVRLSPVVRFGQQFIRPVNQRLELDYIKLFQRWFIPTVIDGYDSIYEFGCGSGYNLVAISQMMPGKTMYGCDFVQSSVDLMCPIADKFGCNLQGILFDMTDPDFDINLDHNACVLTSGAVEQIPGKFKKFVAYLLEKKPSLCIHIEPIIELYDPSNRVDETAIEFHKQRGYTVGFLPHLQALDEANRINLIKVHRMYFGSLRMEGYNYMIWKPTWI